MLSPVAIVPFAEATDLSDFIANASAILCKVGSISFYPALEYTLLVPIKVPSGVIVDTLEGSVFF